MAILFFSFSEENTSESEPERPALALAWTLALLNDIILLMGQGGDLVVSSASWPGLSAG